MSSAGVLMVLLLLQFADIRESFATLLATLCRLNPLGNCKQNTERSSALGAAVLTNYAIQYAAFYATVLAGTPLSAAVTSCLVLQKRVEWKCTKHWTKTNTFQGSWVQDS